jgi:transposase-like protein
MFTKDQIQSFIKENDIKSAGDIQNALKKLFASTVQEFMEAELETHLGYAKHDLKE